MRRQSDSHGWVPIQEYRCSHRKIKGRRTKNDCKRGCVLHEHEPEEAECEITDLDPHEKGSRALNRLLHGHRLSFGTRLWMALLTILGAALFSWLLMSPLHLAGVPQFEKASNEHISTPSHQASSGDVQMIMVHHVIYLIDQNGLVSALWTRHKYVYVLWQHAVAPSSRLVRVDYNVVYLASPDGSRVALRASDGAVLWIRRGIPPR